MGSAVAFAPKENLIAAFLLEIAQAAAGLN